MVEASRPIAVLVDREGLGDVILKVPFLRALRRAFPDHPVWWIATHQTAMADDLRSLFKADVAEVVSQSGLDGPIGPPLERLRAFPPFERVFDTRTRISTVAFARFGLSHRGFYCCLPGYLLCDGRPLAGRRRPRHVAERALSLVTCATGRPADPSGRLEASAAAQAFARQALPPGRSYVGIAPGSRVAAKSWPIDRFCAVAAALAEHEVTPVFFLGPFEDVTPAEITAAAPGTVVLRADREMAPAKGLDRLIAEGQRLALLLANDNGVGHLMGAAGVPVVSLFGPTDAARWRPVAPASDILRAQDFGGRADISAIPPSAVFDAVMNLMRRCASDQRRRRYSRKRWPHG